MFSNTFMFCHCIRFCNLLLFWSTLAYPFSLFLPHKNIILFMKPIKKEYLWLFIIEINFPLNIYFHAFSYLFLHIYLFWDFAWIFLFTWQKIEASLCFWINIYTAMILYSHFELFTFKSHKRKQTYHGRTSGSYRKNLWRNSILSREELSFIKWTWRCLTFRK